MTRIIVLACLFVSSVQVHAQTPDPLPKLIAQLKSDKSETRTAAMLALADLGPKAAPALSQLAEFLPGFDEEERILATLALGKIGKASLQFIEKMLDHTDETTRYYAVWVVSIVGKDANALTPRLLRMFEKDEDEEVRTKSGYALARIAPGSEEVFAALEKVAAKKKDNSPARLAIIEDLRHFGIQGIEPLVRALQEENIAFLALESLSYLLEQNKNDAFAQAILPHLPDILINPNLPGSEIATKSGLVFVLAKHGEKLLPTLQKKLADKNPRTQSEAAQALTQMGANLAAHSENPALTKKIGKLLQPLFTSPDRATRSILASQAPLTDDTQPALEAMLLDDEPEVAHQAFDRLQQQGIDAVAKLRERMKAVKGDDKLRITAAMYRFTREPALQATLWDSLQHKDAAIRHRTACLLANDGFPPEEAGKAKKVVQVLLDGLKNDNAERRLQAARSLQGLQDHLIDHLPALLERLADSSQEMQMAILQTLPAFAKADPKRCIKAMTPLLKHEDMQIRQSVLIVLGSLGREGAPLLAEVVEKEKESQLWTLACDLLGGMRSEGDPAIAALLKAAEDPVRWQPAANALTQIAPDRSFPALIGILLKRDEKLRKTLAYPPAVYENSSKLPDALLADWKKGDLVQSQAIAQTLVKMQSLLPEKKQGALVLAASPLLSDQLMKVQKSLKAKEAKERMEAVNLLGELRQWHAVHPMNFEPAGNDPEAFQQRHQKQLAQIEALFAQARRDADLQVRRQARRLQATEVGQGGGLMVDRGGAFFAPGVPVTPSP